MVHSGSSAERRRLLKSFWLCALATILDGAQDMRKKLINLYNFPTLKNDMRNPMCALYLFRLLQQWIVTLVIVVVCSCRNPFMILGTLLFFAAKCYRKWATINALTDGPHRSQTAVCAVEDWWETDSLRMNWEKTEKVTHNKEENRESPGHPWRWGLSCCFKNHV